MICPKCHTINDDEEKYCRNCGFQLNSSRICPECGKTNDSNSKYCKECGTVLTPVNTFRKQIIEENTKKSFFSLYKVPIICALLIILAIGGVAGISFYNGSSGGDNGFNSLIPSDNNTGGFFMENSSDDPAQAKMEDNETNQTLNDTNKSKTLSEKVENETNDTSKTLTEKVEKANKTNDSSKSLTEKAEIKANQSKKNVNKTASKTEDKSKSLTEKVESKAKANQTGANNDYKTKNSDVFKSLSSNSSSGSKSLSSNSSSISKTLSEKVNQSDDRADDDSGSANDIIGTDDSDDDINEDDSNKSSASSILGLNNSDEDLNENKSDDSNDDSLKKIEMSDVPNLAQKVSEKGYSFSTIEYDDNEYSKAQCIYIFAEYIINVDKGKTSAIEFEDFDEASRPSGDDESQSIEKTDYLSIADRVHSWMDSQGSVPNYVGITVQGQADLSPDKMLELFALVTLDYAISEDLPDSVQI